MVNCHAVKSLYIGSDRLRNLLFGARWFALVKRLTRRHRTGSESGDGAGTVGTSIILIGLFVVRYHTHVQGRDLVQLLESWCRYWLLAFRDILQELLAGIRFLVTEPFCDQ